MNFETKLNVDDSFWVMENNRPVSHVIRQIQILYCENVSCYTVIPKKDIRYFVDSKKSYKEEEIFLSKEDLIKSL
jgi:hypothetical protein